MYYFVTDQLLPIYDTGRQGPSQILFSNPGTILLGGFPLEK
jgi:hypothetical protein